MVIRLNADVINCLDISSCKPRAPYFGNPCGQEHYRLLCYLSTVFDDVLFVDIGTAEGDSAAALGMNIRNRVISFDLSKYPRNEIPNCQYILGDFETYGPALFDSVCMFYDIPHQHDTFLQWCNRLLDMRWDGFLILDDYQHDPVKRKDWDALGTAFTKLDATKYGHFSGTGIINFSKTIQFEME